MTRTNVPQPLKGSILACAMASIYVSFASVALGASFRDGYGRADVPPLADSLGRTETGSGWVSLDYRELEAAGGVPAALNVARVEGARLVVSGRTGTTHPAFAELAAAGADLRLEVRAEFRVQNVLSAVAADRLAIFLRNAGTAPTGTMFTPGMVLFEMEVDGFYLIRGVAAGGVIVTLAQGRVDLESFRSADVDQDGLLESGEPFALRLFLEGPWIEFSFQGTGQTGSLHLAGIPEPGATSTRLLLGRNRISSTRTVAVGLAFDDLQTGAPDEDGDGFRADVDCDDADPAVYPGADEQCNGQDDDCDGAVPADEADADTDGVRVCGGDCDDAEPAVHPGADERCNGRDDDCDGAIPADEADADTDGARVCGGDCDDAEPAVHPGADERCNGRDDDCDGAIPGNEQDMDADGFRGCEGDCRDEDSAVHPGALELPGDDVDQDCDGTLACDPGKPWKNHGQYVSCVARAAHDLVKAGLLTPEEAAALTSGAGRRKHASPPSTPTPTTTTTGRGLGRVK